MNLKRCFSLLACLFIIYTANAVPMRGKDGSAVPGTDRDNPAVWERPIPMTRSAAPGDYSTKRLFYGNEEIPVILVDFPDRKFTITDPVRLRQKFDDMLNRKGYSDTVSFLGSRYYINGSAKDYFKYQSHGIYNPAFKVIGPITADSEHNVYGKDIAGDDASSINSLVKEICGKISGTVDLDKYVQKGGSHIEHMAIIYAGKGQNYNGADPDDIWPQCNTISISLGNIRQITYFTGVSHTKRKISCLLIIHPFEKHRHKKCRNLIIRQCLVGDTVHKELYLILAKYRTVSLLLNQFEHIHGYLPPLINLPSYCIIT